MKELYNKINKEQLKNRLLQSEEKRFTLSFYKYYKIKNVAFFRNYLYYHLDLLDVCGRVYVAEEGINAQVSVPDFQMGAFIEFLNEINFLNGIRLNYAIEDDGKSFYVLKIKIRAKIVADGLDDSTFDAGNGGEHIDAATFNNLADSDQTIVVDMRNHYESEVGHFESAICPDVETFREALPVVENILDNHKEKNIIMYCTGGIRCEKASAYYKHKGFEKVYQLDGGIIEYARQVQEQELENKFKGINFVFDDRLGETISSEIISNCHQCGNPSARHINCSNEACHILFIQCETCAELYNHTCSDQCKDFITLTVEEQKPLKDQIKFNGTKFGKGRFKPNQTNL
ncbi:MAG: rhodanese-related sulfurtransferase [Bacteroidia bacterium]|nr:rhodanese-related sulfurtransferase [Bacteroidia bacterium]